MQAGGAEENTQEGQKAEESQSSNRASAKDDGDEWGKFYSMPPKWKKDSSPSKSGLTDENIGHRLASLLRYHLDESHGISTNEEGWVQAADIVAHAEEVGLDGCTVEDLIRVAETNEHSTRGKRFDSDSKGGIMAKYRHPPKERRGVGYGGDRDGWRDRQARGSRAGRSRGNDAWQGNWNDNSKWEGENYKEGDDSWNQWKKPGFSPSPDDAIVKESSWAATTEKTAQGEAEVKPSQAETVKAACDWEQWFTPDTMEAYFYNTQTEEVFYPGDVADAEAKGWFRYVDTEGEKEGKIYWWHEPTNASFYEEDAVGDEGEE